MLKFKGSPKELKNFLKDTMEKYGEKTTIKEVCKMIGAVKNVHL